MRNPVYLILIPAAMIMLQSCATADYHHTSRKATAKTRYISQSSITETTVVTDLIVEDKKVNGSFSGTNVDEESAKSLAVADALKKVNAEVMVEPVFEVEVKDFRDISVQVQGYPARYKNFRSPTREDSILLGLIAPKVDTVFVDKRGKDDDCCCCDGFHDSMTAIKAGSPPASGPNPFLAANAPAAERKEASTGNFDPEKFKREYIETYHSLKNKGRKAIINGSIYTAAGAVILGLGYSLGYNYDDPSVQNDPAFITGVIVGPTFMALGLTFLPIGISKLSKANKMKREAPQHGIQLAFHPRINPIYNTYMAGISVKF